MMVNVAVGWRRIIFTFTLQQEVEGDIFGDLGSLMLERSRGSCGLACLALALFD